ncbi:glutamate mutase L [Oceanirhabdus seepicola]|uniref:Glutamate mutase L n=2 Tax=Oceanirhabdus seepicola TaxID=2828781 RepID=A0A9J6P441_9CLOT|nr:GlmL-related ornithine degradation protein [Oceanirhabdus seepicola]MCM1990825.1 glutamate mutase L [Oceanirhabdus seepicola]
MKADYIIAEIGSTTTLVTAFDFSGELPHVLAQGKGYTTVLEGDVTIGLKQAIDDIERQIEEKLTWDRMIATSSAAGGLKMTVHGLVHDMTVKAAREAALGAGGIIKMVTSGKMRASDIRRIKKIQPNLIMIAGGTDHGERDTALFNAELIREADLDIPVIYCGNVANQEEIREIFEGKELYVVDNVYPRIDELNVEPARDVIQNAFENNIIKAPGMDKIRDMVDGAIMPTPGAVMQATKMLYEMIGDVIVLDVGGATTDLHSVTEGGADIADILVNPEPKAKRTVEGDLGLFVNSKNVIDLLAERDLEGLTKEYVTEHIRAIPESDEERECSEILCKKAVELAVARHAGYVKRLFVGKNSFVAYGKDLSKVQYIVGTGGALTRLPHGREILEGIKYRGEDISMLPREDAKIKIDTMYIMACAGVLSLEDEEAARKLLEFSIH